METWKLEKDFEPDFQAWQDKPSPTTTGSLLRKVQPAIDKGVSAYAGRQVSPVLKSSARRLALQAIKSYDPYKASLSTHIINHMQGLRRTARQQQTVLHVPERLQLDQTFLANATAELEDRLGRDPTTSELADHTGLSMRRISRVRSYRQPVYEGSMLAAGDAGENSQYSPGVEHDSSQVLMRAVYDDLDPLNQKVMEWTLGLYGVKPLSNQQIANKLRLTPGAISQRKALIQQRLDEMSQYGAF